MFADDQDNEEQVDAFAEESQEEADEAVAAEEQYEGEAQEGIIDGNGDEDEDNHDDDDESEAKSSGDESGSESNDDDEVTVDNADDAFTPTVSTNVCHSACSIITHCVANVFMTVCAGADTTTGWWRTILAAVTGCHKVSSQQRRQ